MQVPALSIFREIPNVNLPMLVMLYYCNQLSDCLGCLGWRHVTDAHTTTVWGYFLDATTIYIDYHTQTCRLPQLHSHRELHKEP